ncbi:MAG: methyl-accepting chemotaxis protein [Erythrobacter sp.]
MESSSVPTFSPFITGPNGIVYDAAEASLAEPGELRHHRLNLEKVQSFGVIGILITAWTVSLSLIAICLWREPSLLWAGLLSAALNILPTMHAVRRQFAGTINTAYVVLVATLQPFMIYLVMQESGMPPQSPLGYLVAVVTIAFLCDARALVWGTSLCIAQLAGMAIFAPDWVFYTDGVVWRSLLHIIGLAVVGAVGTIIITTVKRLLGELAQARRKSDQQVNLLREQAEDLEDALHRVELERRERGKSEADQAAARKEEQERIARDFEASITTVTLSIAKTGEVLERTTKALNAIALETGQSAKDVSVSAEAASNAARNVAEGVSELSHAIANIAVNVSQQTDLTSRATQKSQSGGEAVGGLSTHSDTIGEATRAIARIAERTNLLSLNAAIEAATAGPAGRGFTIVAQEVKALAMQASQAATEIDEFLSGVRSGTLEAERSFEAIDTAITELAEAATTIRWDVESQRKSADTIEDYARAAADDVGAMAKRSKTLASTASTAKTLSTELDEAAATMIRNVRDLEQSTAHFMANLKAS